MHYVTAVKFSGGRSEEHIAVVRWLSTSDGTSKTSTVAAMVDWLSRGNALYVAGHDGRVRVGVVRPTGRSPYLRTYANGKWTDNLKELPIF